MSIEAERLYVTVKADVDEAERGLGRVEDASDRAGAAVRKSGKDAKSGGADWDSAGQRIARSLRGQTRAQDETARSMARLRTGHREFTADMDASTKSMKREADGINQLSGRLKLLLQAVTVLGPGAVAMGSMMIPALAGIASAGGLAAVAGGVMVGSFQGVGDALKAVNKAGLEPTQANLDAARLAMARITPEARGFVRELSKSGPLLKSIRDEGAREMFPGLTRGYQAVLAQGPRVGRIFRNTGREIGDLGEEVGKSLASDRWTPFLDFLAVETPKGARVFTTVAGNVGHTLANLWMATSPQNDDFNDWLVKSTDRLDRWSAKVGDSEGYAKFAAYTAKVGPQVADTLGATADALLEIGEAMAPLGGPVLKGLEGVATAIGRVADSDLGTPIFGGLAALTLYNRALSVTKRLQDSAFMQKHVGGAAGGGPGGPAGFIAGQTQALRSLPAAYREAKAAQVDLTKAQANAQKVTASYVGQLQAVNGAQAKGHRVSFMSLNRLTDSLGKVEMANHEVTAATARATAAEGNRRAALGRTAATAGKAGAAVGALALVTTGLGDSLGVTNTASLALAGSMAGPWGAAIGGAVGGAIDLAHANDDVRTSIAKAQQAMKSGDARAMATSYQELTQHAQKFKDTASDPFSVGWTASMNRAKLLVSLVDGSYKDLQRTMGDMNGQSAVAGAGGILKSQGLIKGSLAATREQLVAQRQAATETGRQFLTLGADVGNAEVSLRSWITSLGAQNAALNSFGDNALKAANRGLRDGLIKQLQEAGPEGALRMKQLANATQAELDRANMTFVRSKQAMDKYRDSVTQATTGQVGKVTLFSRAINSLPKAAVTEIKANGLERSQAAVVELTRKYNLTPKEVATLLREQGSAATKAAIDRVIAAAKALGGQKPTPHLGVKDNASGPIGRVAASLFGLNGRRADTYVYNHIITVRENRGVTGNVGRGSAPNAIADGGTVPTAMATMARVRAALAGGGTVPGSRFPYGDKVLTYLAPGEEVITNKNGEADRFRRDRQAGIIPGYAAGGTTGRAKMSGPGRSPKAGDAIVRHLSESIRKGSVQGINKAANVMSRRLGGALERTWDRRLGAIARKSRAVAAERASLASRIKSTTARRDDLVQRRDNAQTTIRDAISGQANVLNAGADVGTIRDSLATQLGKVREFATNLQRLRSMGYGSAILEQVASAGIEGGAEVAKALLSGSATDVRSINASFSGITSVASSTAGKLASQMYDAGINTANGLIRGMQARRAALDKYMKSVGERMERQLKRALKIKSPSRIADAIGRQVPNGLIQGMERRQAATARASRELARKAIQGFSDTMGPAGISRAVSGPSSGLTPASMSGGATGGNLHLEFRTYNPVAEPQSQTTNKGLARVGAMGLLPR